MSIEKNTTCSVTKIKFMESFDLYFAIYALVVWTIIFALIEKKIYRMAISEIVLARGIAGFFNFTVGGFLPLLCRYLESDFHFSHLFTTIFVTICFKLIVNVSAYSAKTIFSSQHLDYAVLGKKVLVGVSLAIVFGQPIKGFYDTFIH